MNQGENARILAEAAANFTSDQPINIDLLDAVVSIVNSATGDILNQANALLVQLKDDPNAWSKVDVILERSKSTETKYLALQILESTVLTKWKALPVEQREGVKSFVAQHVISLSNSSSPKNAGQQLLLQKLDIVLVQIVKKDWPQNWPTLVPDLIGSADTDIGVCINVMKIFALLSEDVFDFGSQNLTQTAEAHLKKSFCHQFETVFTFCLRVLNQCPSNELVDAILKTIRRFMSWIPITTVFGTDIIPMLTQKFLPMDSYRIAALQCLEEIASITQIPEEYRQNLKDMYYTSIRALAEYVGQTFNFADAYQKGTEADQTFMKALTDFLVIFLKEHGELVESHDGISFELHDYAIRMLISLTTIDDTEIFKMCLEYWLDLTGDLYHLNPFNNQLSMFPEMSRHTVNITRANLYKSRLSELRAIIIDRMAKPEEVLIVENECGEVVREIVKDTDTINLYKTMRETLVFLTHLDQQDTTLKMTQKMATQTTGGAFSWKSLNTLCWAVGSISGAMPEEEEKQFLVLIIRELLGLCEQKRGKDNKAVIAANIMYVVGQYPRFLRAHWKFLKTVVNKLFEFMHESHEGVQDMACDTFIKIAMKCKRHFTVLQPGECEPFVEDMLVNMRRNTCDLSYSQSYVFFEAMGYIISSKGGAEDQAALISRLMNEANSVWDQIIAQLSQDIAALGDISVVKTTIHVLRMNTAVAKAVGGNFFSQLARNLSDMLSLYQLVSQQMSNAVLQSGPEILKTPVVKQIRALKKEILVLISTWTAKQDMVEELKDTVAPPLFDTILFDYKSNVPEARDPKVLSLLAIVATQLSSHMHPHVERVLDSVFMCTLEMINKDFSDFPEHRTNFFQLIVSLVASSFPVIIRLSTEQMRLILEAVYWAFQHSMRNVAELGLDIVKTIVHNVNMMTIIAQENEIAQAFYANHLMSILEHLLAVVTDSSQVHVTGLTYYAETLCVIFRTVIEFAKVPLNQANPSQSNQEYVTEYISNILKQHYSQNLNENQISVFVLGFFSLYDCVKSMKNHLRDFLVALKECASADTADLFLEEREAEIRSIMDRKRQVPGLLNPDFMDDDDEEATMAATGL